MQSSQQFVYPKQLTTNQILNLKHGDDVEYRAIEKNGDIIAAKMIEIVGNGNKATNIRLQAYTTNGRARGIIDAPINNIVLYYGGSILQSTQYPPNFDLNIQKIKTLGIRLFGNNNNKIEYCTIIDTWKLFILVKMANGKKWWTHPYFENEIILSSTNKMNDNNDEKDNDNDTDMISGTNNNNNINNGNNDVIMGGVAHGHGNGYHSHSDGHGHNHSHNHNHNHNHTHRHEQYQSQQQISTQQQQTVSVQLLVEATETQLEQLTNYANTIIECSQKKYNKNNEMKKKADKMVQNCNVKALTGLTLFEMQMDAFKQKTESRQLSNDIGIKNSKKLIRDYNNTLENNLKNKYNNNISDELINYVLKRINPFTNAMLSVTNGNELPSLKTLKHTNFSEDIANRTVTNVISALSHGVPDKVNNVLNNHSQYQNQHESNIKNFKETDDEANIKFNENDVYSNSNGLYQDIKAPLKTPKTAQQALKEAQDDQDKFIQDQFNKGPNMF